jgi:hypothetical protein
MLQFDEVTEKIVDHLMLAEFEKYAKFLYYTKTNEDLFGKNIPDGWFINSCNQIFIIENKIFEKQYNDAFVQLTQYANHVWCKYKFFEIFLVFGCIDNNTKKLKYKIKEYNSNQTYHFNLIWGNFNLDKPSLNKWIITDIYGIYFANSIKCLLNQINQSGHVICEKFIKYLFNESPQKIICNDFVNSLVDENATIKTHGKGNIYVCNQQQKMRNGSSKEIIETFQDVIALCRKCGYLIDDNIPGNIVETILYNLNVPNSNDKFIKRIYTKMNE